MDEQEILLNVEVSKNVADLLASRQSPSCRIVSVKKGSDKHEFGLVEFFTAVAVIKGVEEVVKLALEIRKLLVERAQQGSKEEARCHRPGDNSFLSITIEMTEQELELKVRASFARMEQ